MCAILQLPSPQGYSCHLPNSCSLKASSSRAALGSSSVFSVQSVCAILQQQSPQGYSCHSPNSCSLKASSSRAALGSSSVFSVVSVCAILQLRFIPVYRPAGKELVQRMMERHSDTSRTACLRNRMLYLPIKTQSMKVCLLGVYMVYVFYSSIPLNITH